MIESIYTWTFDLGLIVLALGVILAGVRQSELRHDHRFGVALRRSHLHGEPTT